MLFTIYAVCVSRQVSHNITIIKSGIIKIDIDKNPSIAQRFNVRSAPTLMLFKDGYTIWRQTGVVSLQQLKELVS